MKYSILIAGRENNRHVLLITRLYYKHRILIFQLQLISVKQLHFLQNQNY